MSAASEAAQHAIEAALAAPEKHAHSSEEAMAFAQIKALAAIMFAIDRLADAVERMAPAE
jgi:hypothetical protein